MTKQQILNTQEIVNLDLERFNAIFKGLKKKVTKLFGKVEHFLINIIDLTRSLIASKFIFPQCQLMEMDDSSCPEYLNVFHT